MRTVLITGCSTGIGRATAARLAAGGWTVSATARRPETLSDLEAAGCRVLALDVTSEASMEEAVASAGPVSVLINNAGYSQSGALETLPMESVRRQFETNVFGLLRLTQLVLPGMRAAGAGKIVNVSSMGGRLTFPGGGAYHATKYAVEALSDALRMEVRPFGIDVICIEPGLIRTGFSATAAGGVASASASASADGDPYADFNAAVAKSTREVYEGPLSRLGGDADAVARAIERALGRSRAPTRVPVTPSARLLMGLRRVLPDRAWDRVVGAGFRS
jgi:NAD(P)-dependent dehydrogenase (short-subunit alcohol dehydrogenase family)